MPDTVKDIFLWEIPEIQSMSDDDRFLIAVGTSAYLITKANLKKVLGGLSEEQNDKLDKIIINGDGARVLNNKGQYVQIASLEGYHYHANKETILDKFAVNESNELTFDGKVIQETEKYTLPVATPTTLGGVKPDGTTITINEDGVISGASTYDLPTASQTILGGVKIDGDTIKINDGVISADVIGNWSAGNSYPVGYFVVYKQKLYECITANTDSAWDESHWLLISGNIESGTAINDWAKNTEYNVGDLVIKDNAIIKCIEVHTSTAEIDMTKWVPLTGAKGADGKDGEDGFTPIITITGKEDNSGNTVTITDVNGANSFDVLNGKNGIDGTTPTATVTPTETGATISITDKNGTTTANILNGYVDVNADCAVLYATLTADKWSDTAPYTQTVTMNSITSNHSPIVDIKLSDNTTLWNNEKISYSYIDKIETYDGYIIVTCGTVKPTTDFTIKMKIAGDITGLTFVTKPEFDSLRDMVGNANIALENVLSGVN